MEDDKTYDKLQFKETWKSADDPLENIIKRCQKKLKKCDDMIQSNNLQNQIEREKMIKTNLQTDLLLKDIKKYLETIIKQKKGTEL